MDYQRPLFYFLQGTLWSIFGFHQWLGRLLSLAFSIVLIAAVAWTAAKTVRVERRLAAAVAAIVVVLIGAFATHVVSGLSDVPAAALVALTAAVLGMPKLGSVSTSSRRRGCWTRSSCKTILDRRAGWARCRCASRLAGRLAPSCARGRRDRCRHGYGSALRLHPSGLRPYGTGHVLDHGIGWLLCATGRCKPSSVCYSTAAGSAARFACWSCSALPMRCSDSSGGIAPRF